MNYEEIRKIMTDEAKWHDTVEIFQDISGQWRWRRVAFNNKVISSSGESFTRKWSAKRAAKRANPGVHIKVVK